MAPLPDCQQRNVSNELENGQDFTMESEDDDLSTMGYERLSTDVDDDVIRIERNISNPNSDILSNNISALNGSDSVLPRDISFDSEKAEEITSLMSNIQIPSSNFPDWSFHINEDEWKQKLLDSINTAKTYSPL